MKLRTDFVSNSSSSSFIVISDNISKVDIQAIKNECQALLDYRQTLFVPTEHGAHEFGWENIAYSKFLDKINFAAIQLCYMLHSETYDLFHPEEYEKWKKEHGGENCYVSQYKGKFAEFYKMLYDVCLETIGIKIELNNNIMKLDGLYDGEIKDMCINLDYDYYIDHQSSVSEESCMEMFESKDTLKNFLFSTDSYVNTGNDNDW